MSLPPESLPRAAPVKPKGEGQPENERAEFDRLIDALRHDEGLIGNERTARDIALPGKKWKSDHLQRF
jgi:hypothetical protein